MRQLEELAWWQQAMICGNEGEEEAQSTGDAGDAGDAGNQGDPDPAAADAGDGDGDDEIPDNLEEIKAALKKERTNSREAKSLRKQLAAAQKLLDEAADKDKSEKERAEKRATQAEERAAKLASGYKRSAVDTAIERAARAAKFHDPTDAIAQIDRSGITVEQDEDDPSDVTVDSKSVVAAVKALAAAKKHLIDTGEGKGEGDPSGSTFGSGPSGKKGLTPERLKELYPSL